MESSGTFNKQAEQIDLLMQAGYQALDRNQPVAACFSWRRVWLLILEGLEQHAGLSIEALDKAFHGRQSIYVWANDFIRELAGAGSLDPFFYQIRIDVCRDYLKYSDDPDDPGHLSRRRAIAESLFRLGRRSEGDDAFAELTRQNPQWAWGWTAWAYQYSFSQKDPWHDPAKAEKILREGLAVVKSTGRQEIARQLRELLLRQGRTAAAGLI